MIYFVGGIVANVEIEQYKEEREDSSDNIVLLK